MTGRTSHEVEGIFVVRRIILGSRFPPYLIIDLLGDPVAHYGLEGDIEYQRNLKAQYGKEVEC